MIGGIVDLDLLFQIPQEYARIIGGIERKQAQEGQQWRGKLARMVEEPLGKKAPYIGPSKIQPLQPKNAIPGTTGLFPGTTGLFRHYRTFPGVTGAPNAFFLCAPRYQTAVLPDPGTTGSWSSTNGHHRTKTTITFASGLRFR